MFRFFFSRPMAGQLTGTLIRSSFFGGLGLIGLGMLVYWLRDVIAFVLMGLFFFAGFSAIAYAVRLLLLSWRMRRSQGDGAYRENVTIHRNDGL